MPENEKKDPRPQYAAGDAILYCIGDRAFPGIILSARYKSGLLLFKSGWEYIIICGGLTYRVQEEDLWPHQYRHDLICPFAKERQEPCHMHSGTVSDDHVSPETKPTEPAEDPS